MEGDVDVLAGLGIGTELHGRAHDDGAVVIGGAGALAGVPDEAAAVGDDAGGDGRAVVAAPANQHYTQLGHLAVDLEVVDGLLGGGNILAVVTAVDQRGAVRVLGADLRVGVHHVGRGYGEERASGVVGGSSVGGTNILSVGYHGRSWSVGQVLGVLDTGEM